MSDQVKLSQRVRESLSSQIFPAFLSPFFISPMQLIFPFADFPPPFFVSTVDQIFAYFSFSFADHISLLYISSSFSISKYFLPFSLLHGQIVSFFKYCPHFPSNLILAEGFMKKTALTMQQQDHFTKTIYIADTTGGVPKGMGG